MADTTAPTIHQAMAAVMNDVKGVGKHGRNQQQNFSFRGIDDVLNAVGPALRTHGVFLAPCVGDFTTDIVEVGQKKTPMRSVTLVVSYTFHGPAGDSVSTTVVGEAMDAGDKAFSKAMSVALRTALIQTLALPTDEKDPDLDTYERAPRGEQRPPQQHHSDGGQQRQNGGDREDPQVKERRDAWTEAWDEAKKLRMSKKEFAEDFEQVAGVPEAEGTAAQFRTYAAQLRESRNTAGAAS